MAEPFLTERITLTKQVVQNQNKNTISCKHFFSGAAAYADGQVFMSLSPAGLALKLPEDQRDLILQQGGKPLKYFPKSPIKKGYAVLSPTQREDTDGLYNLIIISIDHVLGQAE
ncbi:MAG: TfoX/Sxy family protein [Halopseudomonas aestusnigri]